MPAFERWYTWAAAALLLAWLAAATWLVLRRHATFHTNLFDLGYYTQTLWNTAHGRWFATSLKPPTYLADHFSPILIVLVPLIGLIPDARVLLVVEVLALGAAILPAYLYLRSRHAVLALVLMLAFVWNPLLHWVLRQEFHEIMLAVPTLAIALAGLLTGRTGLLTAGLALTLLVREDMAVYVASFGLYFLLFKRGQRPYGALLILASVVWFVVVVTWVIPALGGGEYRHTGVLLPSANADAGFLQALVQSPLSALERVLSLNTLDVLVYLFLPVAGLALLAPGEQVLWAPALLLLLASTRPLTSSLQGWHAAPLLPLLWVCIARTMGRLTGRWAIAGSALLLVGAALGFLVWSPMPGGGYYDKDLYTVTEHHRVGQRIIASIPGGVSVATQNGPGAHLATREVLYLFPWFDFEAPPQVILLDEATDRPYPLDSEELHAAIVRMQADPAVETLWEEDGYFVFRIHSAAPISASGHSLTGLPVR